MADQADRSTISLPDEGLATDGPRRGFMLTTPDLEFETVSASLKQPFYRTFCA